MNKITSVIILALCIGLLAVTETKAGNPDRQGEAGAYELLINPWARSAGLNGLVTSSITGIEAMRFNPAGLARTRSTEIGASYGQYLAGTGLSTTAAGLAQRLGKDGAIGVSLMALSFGEISLTTTNQPEGLATFSPTFFNIGLGYGHVFRDPQTNKEKITVGFTVRMANQSLANASATGVCFDAGVQYYTGKHNQLKLGLALRNIGSRMKFRGDGLSFVGVAPNGTTALAVEGRGAGFEMPSLLHIGASYDFLLPTPVDPIEEDKKADEETDADKDKDDKSMSEVLGYRAVNRLTLMFNFTANSFSRDQFGLGLEYAFKEMFMFRIAYKYERGMFDPLAGTASAGLTAGATVEVPFKKNSQQRIGFDYAFEYTRIFKGTHTVGLKLTL
ncbi:MAG: PorV/PorQ family protein [Saprospiraceae bacterium]|nr:PorV/PorQ family protein [Saprospiraceae bacterium]